jgi:hypothetical protein
MEKIVAKDVFELREKLSKLPSTDNLQQVQVSIEEPAQDTSFLGRLKGLYYRAFPKKEKKYSPKLGPYAKRCKTRSVQQNKKENKFVQEIPENGV